MYTNIYTYVYTYIHNPDVYTYRYDTSQFLACKNAFGMTVEGICLQWLWVIGMWNVSCHTFHAYVWLWKRHVCNDCGSSACGMTHNIYSTCMNECGRNMCTMTVGHRHMEWLSHVLLTYEWAFLPQSSPGMTVTSISDVWMSIPSTVMQNAHSHSCGMLISAHLHQCSFTWMRIHMNEHPASLFIVARDAHSSRQMLTKSCGMLILQSWGMLINAHSH